MYIISQIETNSNQILSFKSLSDADRYYDIFIRRSNLNKLSYISPTLIASQGYTQVQLNNWDFFNCIISIPIFSEKFKVKVGDVLSENIKFIPGEIISSKGHIRIYMGLITNIMPLFDKINSNTRLLEDGTNVPDYPNYYHIQTQEFYIARDDKYPSKYVVSDKFKELCNSNGLELVFSPVLLADR